jgi:hypothetical protein
MRRRVAISPAQASRAALQEDQQAPPVEALGQDAGERPEQQHGQGAHHRHGGDGQGGMGGLEGPERGGQHFQPAHGIGDAAEHPEAPVVGRAKQPRDAAPRRAGARRTHLVVSTHGLDGG